MINEGVRYFIMSLLFLNIFVFVYMIIKKYAIKASENTSSDVQGNFVTTSARCEYQDQQYGRKKHKIVRIVDTLIARSNIQTIIPNINSYAVLTLSSVLGAIGFILSYKILNNGITSIVFFTACALIPVYILESISSYYNSKIERNFLYFLNVLSNFAQLKDDVFFAFEKSIGYIDEPLNNFCEVFVEEVRRGMPIEVALENFKDKVENSKFKLFIKNAQLCVKFGGSFLKLAANNLELVKQLQIEKARRKSETAFGKGLIYFMMIVNIAIAFYMFNLYPNTLTMIKTDFYGQVIVLMNTLNLFIVFYLSLKLQKLDY